MITTSDIRKGLCIRYSNDIYKIIEFLHVKPGKGPAFVRTKLKSVSSGKVVDNTFTAGHKIDDVRVENRKYQFLYKDGETYHFIKTVMEKIPKTKINGKYNNNESSYAILNLCLPINIDKKTILDFKLDMAGISCSSGSACQSGSSQPSHVLSEMLSESDMKKISLRFSFSKFNSIKQVDYVVDFLRGFIEEN